MIGNDIGIWSALEAAADLKKNVWLVNLAQNAAETILLYPGRLTEGQRSNTFFGSLPLWDDAPHPAPWIATLHVQAPPYAAHWHIVAVSVPRTVPSCAEAVCAESSNGSGSALGVLDTVQMRAT
jgi:hypothetical protein